MLALPFVIGVLSLMGFPPTAGFFGKWYVFNAALSSGSDLAWLVVIGVLTSVIGAYYYLRVVWYMYFADPADNTPINAAIDVRIIMSANALGLLVLGLWPGGLLDLCARVLGA